LIGVCGGIAAGTSSRRRTRAGANAASARRRVALIAAVLVAMTTALVPLTKSDALTVICIAVSYFCSSGLSVNLYALPIDIFGPKRAAFGVASLTCAYGVMQTFFLPWAGRMIDTQGFQPVCWAAAVLPVAGVGLLYATREKSHS